MADFNLILNSFKDHYASRLEKTRSTHLNNKEGIKIFRVTSPMLKKGNSPSIFHHGRPTRDVIIITHGLSDSPFYVRAIGKYFYRLGVNVVIPLLPGHGLKDPDDALEDDWLDTKWRSEMKNCIRIALQLGKRVSLGGFSAGGALSFNAILKYPEQIKGGLFLFSAAISIGLLKDASRLTFLDGITKMVDGRLKGIGRNPYKYPVFPNFGAMELGDIIRENIRLAKNKKIEHPVFAAHLIHDTVTPIEGILDLLENNCTNGVAYLLNTNIAHGELPLEKDITLDPNQTIGPKKIPKANPEFDLMMESAISFFKKRIAQGKILLKKN